MSTKTAVHRRIVTNLTPAPSVLQLASYQTCDCLLWGTEPFCSASACNCIQRSITVYTRTKQRQNKCCCYILIHQSNSGSCCMWMYRKGFSLDLLNFLRFMGTSSCCLCLIIWNQPRNLENANMKESCSACADYAHFNPTSQTSVQ